MTVQQVLFLILGAVTLGAAVGVVASRRPLSSALWLLLAFFGVAGIFVLLEAPFFAAAQLFIYMGAIGVIIIFAIMLTRGMMRQQESGLNDQWWLAAILALILLGVLSWLAIQYAPLAEAAAVPQDALKLLGMALVDPAGFALPFEVASVLLVMALIGAVAIARER